MPNLATYHSIIADTCHSVGQAIGAHVMTIILEHALWSTKAKFEEAALISLEAGRVSLDGLASLPPERAQVIAHDFMLAIVNTLGRLVGLQIAQQLMQQLQLEHEEEL